MEQYCVLGKPCIWTPVWPTKVTTTRNRSVHFFVFTSKNISQRCITDMFRIFQIDFDKTTNTFLFSLMKYISPSILHLPRLLKHVYFKWWLRQTKRKHSVLTFLSVLLFGWSVILSPRKDPGDERQEKRGQGWELWKIYSTRLEAWHFRHGALCNMGHSGMGPCLSFPPCWPWTRWDDVRGMRWSGVAIHNPDMFMLLTWNIF